MCLVGRRGDGGGVVIPGGSNPSSPSATPDAKEKLDKLWDFLAMTNDEDIAVCESVQEGIMCGYDSSLHPLPST